ncbi:hypothetical protein CUZ56_00757 [Saezia sanguinis]|uniref:Uncharacterized protein n=1 Tax=Saezia sanguinis TaxID=1965230 RepID=A0A433SHN6_9BURK|nr:hypothetical protein [Saezia sanguinis]RUS68269.1 hypothetical protein CUZ56_00757 [Saezia sanguinis]
MNDSNSQKKKAFSIFVYFKKGNINDDGLEKLLEAIYEVIANDKMGNVGYKDCEYEFDNQKSPAWEFSFEKTIPAPTPPNTRCREYRRRIAACFSKKAGTNINEKSINVVCSESRA